MPAANPKTARRGPTSILRAFINSGSFGGIVLMAAAGLAMAVANSPLAPNYFTILRSDLGPLSVLHWVNDAVMALFFVLVGLEIPAAPEVDPLWAMLAGAGVPVTFHIGGQQGFFGSDVWQNADLLKPGSFSTGEPVGPHMLATMHLSVQNYLTCMIFGGVFERHPDLRVGIIELGATWVGPFVDLLEHRMDISGRVRSTLSRRPTQIFTDQIRVTPFFFERTARQIERYGMPEIYAFSTDFPHPEGGTDPIGIMAADIAPLGDTVLEGFFVGNAELLLPN